MASAGRDLRRGRIAWARVSDRRGSFKQRPLIIVTATDDIREDEPLIAMAITTSFGEPPPADHIPLPWHPQGRSITRLRKRSAAVLSWVIEIDAADLLEFGGDVPPALMIEILHRLG